MDGVLCYQMKGDRLITLDLSHNKLGHRGVTVLAQQIVVRMLPCLHVTDRTSTHLNSCRFFPCCRSGSQGNLHKLQTLSLESTGLIDGDLLLLSDALQACLTLKTLVLRGNAFREDGIAALGQLLVRRAL